MLRDAVSAIILFVFGAVVFFISLEFRDGAQVFPVVVSSILMIASALLFMRTVISIRREAVPAESGQSAGSQNEVIEGSFVSRGEVTLISLSALYIFGVPILGFVPVSLIFIPLAAYLLGMRSWLVMAGTTILFVSGATVLFAQIFRTPLPKGILSSFLN